MIVFYLLFILFIYFMKNCHYLKFYYYYIKFKMEKLLNINLVFILLTHTALLKK